MGIWTGFSTLVFAHAISINKKDFDVSGIKFTSFGHSAIEAETRWIRHTKKQFPKRPSATRRLFCVKGYC